MQKRKRFNSMKEVCQNTIINMNMPLKEKIGALQKLCFLQIGDTQVSVVDKQTGKGEYFSIYDNESVECFKERVVDYLVEIYNSKRINGGKS